MDARQLTSDALNTRSSVFRVLLFLLLWFFWPLAIDDLVHYRRLVVQCVRYEIETIYFFKKTCPSVECVQR